jgi:hypothetical protein
MERTATATVDSDNIAKLLGISRELAASYLATGHVTLASDTQQTFIRLRDIYQVLRHSQGYLKTSA